MHVVDDFTFETENGPVRSINLGTWLDQPRVLKVEGAEIQMLDVSDLIQDY